MPTTKQRKIVSSIIAIVFIVMAVTGILMYFQPFQKPIAALHTLFAFAFLIGACFHIFNNFKPLKNYLRRSKSRFLPNALFWGLIVGAVVLIYGVINDVSGFMGLYNWGNEYRNSQLGKKIENNEYEIITLEEAIGDVDIAVEGKIGRTFKYPMFAMWAEDTLGNYLHTIYVSRVMGTSIYDYKKGEKGAHLIRRPAGLPYWAHKRNIRAEDGLMIPLGDSPDLDGYTGATPVNNFVISSRAKLDSLQQFHLLFEVNQSYDWNDYFSKDRFPDDEIYSGPGQSAQPALVYRAEVNLAEFDSTKNYFLQPIGHSHHSGKNGDLFTDLSTMTTALEIIDRLILEVRK